MKYVDSLQDGHALEVLPSEYDVVGRAFDVSWPLEVPPGTRLLYLEADLPYASLALDRIKNSADEPNFVSSERVPAMRGLSKILAAASRLEAYKAYHTAQARFSTAEFPEDQKELLREAEAWTRTTATAVDQRLYYDGMAMDIVGQGKVILAPWAAETALGGLRSIARTHGIIGAIRRRYDPNKLPLREDRIIRKGAIKILRGLKEPS
jgi:hypothetical protein